MFSLWCSARAFCWLSRTPLVSPQVFRVALISAPIRTWSTFRLTFSILRDRIVNHLDSQYFHIFEDGVAQQIVAVGEDDVPASIGFVFDTSASIGAKLELSRQAIAEFLRSANSEDEFFFLPFGSQPGPVTGFTNRPEELWIRWRMPDQAGLPQCSTPSARHF